MTISTTSNSAVAQGNGVTTSFSFSFPVPLASYLQVYYADTTGAISLLPPSSYFASGIGTAAGGTVTYPLAGNPIPIGSSLLIKRVLPYQQLTDIINQSGYYPNVVENALDNLEMQIQQLAQGQSLSLQVPFSVSPASLVFPSALARAGKLAGFDASGNAIAYPITASVGAGNLTSEGPFVAGTNFTPGVTTTLTLTQSYGSPSNVQVHFDGTYQGTDQYSLSGNSLIFTSPIPVGVSKVYVVGGTTLSNFVPAQSSVDDQQLAWGNILGRVTDSVAAMAALNPATYTRSFPAGYYAPADGGGGPYAYSASTPQTLANGGTIIASTFQGATGCWLLESTYSVSFKQFGSKFDGANDDTITNQAALNALPKIGKLTMPPGTSITGVLTLPVGSTSGWIIEGAGVGVSILQEKTVNQGIFGAPNGIVFGAEFRSFSLKCHASSNGSGAGILVSGYYNTKFSKIGYLSNGTGYWANLFLLSASPQLSYGNTIEGIHIINQVGPSVPISFGNNGAGVNYNANACRISGGLIANNTMIGTCIDATRSINTVIERVWLENNSNTTTNTGLQSDASGGVASGKGTIIRDNYMELLSPYVVYPSYSDGPSHNGLVVGNNFSASWQTTTTFFNNGGGAPIGNLWVGNNENGTPILFSGAGDTNRKIGSTLTNAQALALIPAISNYSGVSGSLSVSSTAVQDVDMEGNIYFMWNLSWVSSNGGANLASTFSFAALTGYSLKTLNATANTPLLNNTPVPCSIDVANGRFTAAMPSTTTYGLFVQATFKKTW